MRPGLAALGRRLLAEGHGQGMIAPQTIIRALTSIPVMIKPFLIVLISSNPAKVPRMVGVPPNRLVPSRITANLMRRGEGLDRGGRI